MQASKLSFRYWFIAMHLLTGTKKTFSALELQRQIGHKFYEPIWYMLQKLRTTMGLRDHNYPINKIVEIDEGFFESVDTEKEREDKDEKRKRGRGSQKQSVNRRYFGEEMFDRLLTACVTINYKEIVKDYR